MYRVDKVDFSTLVLTFYPLDEDCEPSSYHKECVDVSVKVALMLSNLAGAEALDLCWAYDVGQNSV